MSLLISFDNSVIDIQFAPANEVALELVPVIQQFFSGPLVTQYTHTQSVAATEWIVNHNFGFRPSVTALSVGGREMLCEVLHTSVNQIRLYFDSPMAGSAVCS